MARLRGLYLARGASALWNAEFGQFVGDGLSLRRGTDVFVDEPDSAIDADEERPPGGERLILVDHAVRLRNTLGGIAQEREIDSERSRELLVRLRRVDTDREICDVERPDLIAALTERLALGGSTAGEGFCKPRQHDRLLAPIVR